MSKSLIVFIIVGIIAIIGPCIAMHFAPRASVGTGAVVTLHR